MASPYIYLGGNDYLIEHDAERPATTTGEGEAAAGLSGISGWISATDGGAAIHATLSVSLTERSGTPGRYFGILDGADIATRLSAYAGQFCYEVVDDGGNIESSFPIKVLPTRQPDA